VICSSLNEKWSILLIGDAVGQIHFVDSSYCSKMELSINFDSKSIDENESDSLIEENTIKEEEEETIERILETISIPTSIQDINSSQNPSTQSEQQQQEENERRKGISSISIRRSDYKLVAVGCWDSKVYLYSMKLGKKKKSRKKLLKVQLLSILGFHSSTVNTLVFQHPLLSTSEIFNSSSDLQNDQIEEEKVKKNDDDENDDQTASHLGIVKHPLLFTGSQDEKIGIWNLYSETKKKKK